MTIQASQSVGGVPVSIPRVPVKFGTLQVQPVAMKNTKTKLPTGCRYQIHQPTDVRGGGYKTMKLLVKKIAYEHGMGCYDLDQKEFEDGIKYLRKERTLAIKGLKTLGATDNIRVEFGLEAGYYDEGPEFKLYCYGTRLETEEEMHSRKRKSARAAETRAIKAMKDEEKELNLYVALKAKYERRDSL